MPGPFDSINLAFPLEKFVKPVNKEDVIEFGMWLTTRDKTIKVGASETVYDMNDALTEFIAMKEAQAKK